MFTPTLRLRFAVEKSLTAGQNEPRPCVLRAMIATEHWRRVLCLDGTVNDAGHENPQHDDVFANNARGNDTETLDVKNCNDSDDKRMSGIQLYDDINGTGIERVDSACRHEFVKSCFTNLCHIGSKACIVCENRIWAIWKSQTCVDCDVKKHDGCVLAETATGAIVSTSSERDSSQRSSGVDQVESGERTSANALPTCVHGVSSWSVVEGTVSSSDGAVGPAYSEQRVRVVTPPAPLDTLILDKIRTTEESIDETVGQASAIKADNNISSDGAVGPANSEQCVRVITPPAPLETEAFERTLTVEESVDETVGQPSAIEADKNECKSNGAVGLAYSGQRVRVITPPAPLETVVFERTRAVNEPVDETWVVIGDCELPGKPKTDEVPVINTEIKRTAVRITEANETVVSADRPVSVVNGDRPPVAEEPIVRRSPTVREENIKLFIKCKMLPRNNAHWEMSNYMKNVNRFLNKPQEQMPVDHLIKYWMMQNRLFSRFSMGILLDEESFFSVCPEVLCSHIANKCRCDTIVDPFCGAGGNIIQFTKTCSRVIGIDVDNKKIKLARNNAKVYGVQNRVQLRTGDYFQCDKKLKTDVVFMSPPWGGPEYINEPVYSLAGMCSEYGGGQRILEIARKIAPKIAIHLPRNLNKNECVMIARDLNFKYVLFENNYIGNKLNSTTMYLK